LFGRQDFVGEQRGQYGGQEPVFVLRQFGPRGDEIGQPEPAGRLASAQHDSPFVTDGHGAALTPSHILADVVQIGVDGRRVAPGRPIPGRSFEGDVDAGTGQCAVSEQRLEDLVHLVNHRRAPAVP